MPDCPRIVIWNVPQGSKLFAQSTAKNGNTPTNDYDASVHIKGEPSGSVVDWAKRDLDPGPAVLAPLEDDGYGAKAKLLSGPSGPTVTLHSWIEAPGGATPFDCIWTNSDAGTQIDVVITLVVGA